MTRSFLPVLAVEAEVFALQRPSTAPRIHSQHGAYFTFALLFARGWSKNDIQRYLPGACFFLTNPRGPHKLRCWSAKKCFEMEFYFRPGAEAT